MANQTVEIKWGARSCIRLNGNKFRQVCNRIGGITFIHRHSTQIKDLQAAGYGEFPICVAKTQYSYSTDPSLRAAPVDHSVNIREVRLSAGAEFVVMICGDVMTMPGLPVVPSAEHIDLVDGRVVGLF